MSQKITTQLMWLVTDSGDERSPYVVCDYDRDVVQQFDYEQRCRYERTWAAAADCLVCREVLFAPTGLDEYSRAD